MRHEQHHHRPICSPGTVTTARRIATRKRRRGDGAPTPEKSEEELDAESQIMHAAVTYTALNGAFNGAWIAEHTGNSTVAEIVIKGTCPLAGRVTAQADAPAEQDEGGSYG